MGLFDNFRSLRWDSLDPSTHREKSVNDRYEIPKRDPYMFIRPFPKNASGPIFRHARRFFLRTGSAGCKALTSAFSFLFSAYSQVFFKQENRF